ncbi:TonB-dependent receptor [Parasediminibacterium sp. JCM 36343]|uniref:TonB-dependent receptor n=1 Tax=Parasediminibacterium sp. JCM 36343 TaxID=3374279 RepID=UPI00397E4F60
MNLKQYLFVLMLFVLPFGSFCQQAKNKFSINGTVRDKATGETLIGANVSLIGQSGLGTASNAYGFYSVSAPAGTYQLVISYTGYLSDTSTIVLNKNIIQQVSLGKSTGILDEVTVTTRRKSDNIAKPIMGVQKLSIDDIKNIPVLFGEKDILKTIQLLPGIKSAGEGNSGFYVRGGSADQNLILLDEAVVYNPSHLLGFFSTFNSDAIKEVTVYKGGMPAEYGGRLSSVLDIKMNDGNNKKFGVSGGVGLIASRLNVEGPIEKDKEKGSFTVSGRRTYADVFLKLSKDSSLNKNTLYFYDLNAKANYKLNEKNRLYWSAYTGRDNFGFGSTFGIDYGNLTGTLRWNHVFNSRLFSNTSLIYSNYSYRIKINSGTNDITITSKIRDLNLKEDLQYFINANNRINFGLNLIHHDIIPGTITASGQSSFNNLELQKKLSLEDAAYISHEWSATPKINITYGLRFSAFSALGPGTFYRYDADGNTIDSSKYTSGQEVKTYLHIEPRFATSYKLNEDKSIKFSYNRNVQNLHLLSNATGSSPTDLWIGSSNNVKPEVADQVALGYYQNFKKNVYEFSAEVYYKTMQNQIDYKNGAELRANENVESQLLFGKGRAYGLELFFKKRYGKFNGWVGYTLAKTERQVDGINNGKWYDATQDRTHEVSVVAIYQASKKWTFSSTFVFYTGNAVTQPSGKYNVNGHTYFYYTERNGYRMPNYHRLDLAATLQGKKTKKYDSNWSFSIYNAYNRANAFSIDFQEDPDNPQKTQAVQTTLFKLIPSVTYNFKF